MPCQTIYRITKSRNEKGRCSTGLGQVDNRLLDGQNPFYKCLDVEIGASDGLKTNYILVQYNSTGSVHGYPATADYLRGLGEAKRLPKTVTVEVEAA